MNLTEETARELVIAIRELKDIIIKDTPQQNADSEREQRRQRTWAAMGKKKMKRILKS